MRQLSRDNSSQPLSPSLPTAIIKKKSNPKANCWIRNGSECLFNFKSTQLNTTTKNDGRWLRRLNHRSKRLSSTLRCKYSAPVENSKRRIENDRLSYELWEPLSGGLPQPEFTKQNNHTSRRILSKLAHRPHKSNLANNNSQPPFEEEERPIPHSPDYKRIAFFLRMKRAMKKPIVQQLLTLQPVPNRQPTLRTKVGRQFSIAPWDDQDTARGQLLPS